MKHKIAHPSVSRLFPLAILFLIWGTALSQAQIIVVSDSEMANFTTTHFASSGTPTQTTTHELSGGADDTAYRRTIQSTPTGQRSYVFHAFDGATFDPGQIGEINSLQFSFAFNRFDSNAGTFHFGVVQDGLFFRSEIPNRFSTSQNNVWLTDVSDELVASDFLVIEYDQTPGSVTQPDFSTNGQPISFGYISWAAPGQTASQNRVTGVDDFSVTIAYTPIPEPSQGFLLAAMLGAVCIHRRRRLKQG